MNDRMCGTTAEHAELFDRCSWDRRYENVAKFIPHDSTVLDLGGGDGKLEHFLFPDVEYTCVDIAKRNGKTIVADFNKGEFPFFRNPFDFVVCLGIVEYLDDVDSFLAGLRRYSQKAIITYNSLLRPPQVFKNWYSHIEIQRKLNDAGWQIEEALTFNGEKIYFCKQIYKLITPYAKRPKEKKEPEKCNPESVRES